MVEADLLHFFKENVFFFHEAPFDFMVLLLAETETSTKESAIRKVVFMLFPLHHSGPSKPIEMVGSSIFQVSRVK